MQKIIEKLGDSKVAIRQATVKLIKEHYYATKKLEWFDYFIKGLKEKN